MKKKTVVIHQPDFLPYLGFFDRLIQCDFFVLLDHVQYVRGTSRSWMNRDKIKTPRGEQWITINVKKASMGTPINQILLNRETDWRKKNLRLMYENYRKALYFEEIFPEMQQLYDFECELLMEFNWRSIQMLMQLLDIQVSTIFSSSLQVHGKNNELLVGIVKALGGGRYLSGIGALDYYCAKPFDEAGIEVVWQKFDHPVYSQLYGEFIPNLSSIDLLMNCGIATSRKILRRQP